MSVIIEGFDKPKNCYPCPFNNSDCWCNLTKGVIDRDDWYCSAICPIKELPKGHGDLVDYEKLKNNVREYGAYAEATLSHIKPKTIIEADAPKRRKGTPLEENDNGYNCENWIP